MVIWEAPLVTAWVGGGLLEERGVGGSCHLGGREREADRHAWETFSAFLRHAWMTFARCVSKWLGNYDSVHRADFGKAPT